MTLSTQGHRRLAALETLAAAVTPLVAVDLPIRLESRANDHTSKHWAKRARTSKTQRFIVDIALKAHRAKVRARMLMGGLVVRLVRVAPNQLDDDNLGHAFKAIRDGIAAVLEVDDRDPRVTFIADAERGGVRQYSVRLEFYGS